MNDAEKQIDLLILQMFGQRLGQTQTQAFPDRVVDREAVLIDQIVVEETNAADMTIDRFR